MKIYRFFYKKKCVRFALHIVKKTTLFQLVIQKILNTISNLSINKECYQNTEEIISILIWAIL